MLFQRWPLTHEANILPVDACRNDKLFVRGALTGSCNGLSVQFAQPIIDLTVVLVPRAFVFHPYQHKPVLQIDGLKRLRAAFNTIVVPFAAYVFSLNELCST